MKNRFLFLVTFVSALVITSCNKTEFTDEDFTIAEDEVFAIQADESADQMINPAAFGGHLPGADTKGFPGPGKYRFFPFRNFPECAEVTVGDGGFPKDIVIDFNGDCATWHGNSINGKILITVSDAIINEGATIKVVYDGLTFGARAIEREALMTNEGKNANGNLVISFSSRTKVTYRNGHVSVREFAGEKEWISGFLSPEITDDKFHVTGSGTVTVDDEFRFSREITTPLYIDRACRFILSGVVEITRNGETMTIDYGDGECDNIATVTKDDETEEIELGQCKFRNDQNRFKRHFRKLRGWW